MNRRTGLNPGILFILPAMVLLLIVLGWPLYEAVKMSLYRGMISSKVFVGVEQYIRLVKDEAFRIALLNTLKFTILGVGSHLALGMVAALMLHSLRFAHLPLRILATIPWFIPGAVVAVIWRLLLDTHFGVINHILRSLHLIEANLAWVSSPHLALTAVILAFTWRNYPYVMIALFAGLQAIPQEQYEAAKIDGASGWQEFIFVTLPNLRHIIMVVTTLDLIWTFKEFDLVQVLTGGGPLYFSEVLATRVYNASFQNFDFGFGSAIAVIMLLISLVFAAIYMRIMKSGGELQ